MATKAVMKSKTSSHSEGILPECAERLATITERLLQTTQIQAHIAETVFGNGKIGLKDQTEDNTRDITTLTSLMNQANRVREEETATRKRETEERMREVAQRKSDTTKWWLGIVAAIIIAFISIIQSVAVSTALSNLDRLIPTLAK